MAYFLGHLVCYFSEARV